MAGRFQSRILSFFSRRRLKLIDRIKAEVRRLQLAVNWGAQILLYPIYLAFQGGRLAGRQVRQAIAQGAAQNFDGQMPPADTPLVKVLNAIGASPFGLKLASNALDRGAINEAALDSALVPPRQKTQSTPPLSGTPELQIHFAHLSPSSQTEGSDLAGRLSIQGLASQCDTRHLVLVTVQNQVLDVLTPAQQLTLHQRIAWELADYWQLRRFNDALRSGTALPSMQYALPLPIAQPNALPVVKQLTRLIQWLQTGSVAMTVDLFQESRFANWSWVPSSGWSQRPLPRLPIAQAESCPKLSDDSSPKDPDWLTFEELFNPALQLMATEPLDYLSLNEIDRDPDNLTSGSESGSQTPENQTEPEQTDRRDLGDRRSPVPHPPNSLPLTSPSTIAQERPLADSTDPKWPKLETDPWDAAEASIVVTAKATSQASKHLSDDPQVLKALNSDSENWIETPSQTVGYVKHPLERLLNWLDRWMVRLEEISAKLWQRLQKLWERR